MQFSARGVSMGEGSTKKTRNRSLKEGGKKHYTFINCALPFRVGGKQNVLANQLKGAAGMKFSSHLPTVIEIDHNKNNFVP